MLPGTRIAPPAAHDARRRQRRFTAPNRPALAALTSVCAMSISAYPSESIARCSVGTRGSATRRLLLPFPFSLPLKRRRARCVHACASCFPDASKASVRIAWPLNVPCWYTNRGSRSMVDHCGGKSSSASSSSCVRFDVEPSSVRRSSPLIHATLRVEEQRKERPVSQEKRVNASTPKKCAPARREAVAMTERRDRRALDNVYRKE